MAFSDQHLGRLSVMRCSSAHCTLPCVHARGGHCTCTPVVVTACARSWRTLYVHTRGGHCVCTLMVDTVHARSWWTLYVHAHGRHCTCTPVVVTACACSWWTLYVHARGGHCMHAHGGRCACVLTVDTADEWGTRECLLLFTTHPMFETNKNAFQIYECY